MRYIFICYLVENTDLCKIYAWNFCQSAMQYPFKCTVSLLQYTVGLELIQYKNNSTEFICMFVLKLPRFYLSPHRQVKKRGNFKQAYILINSIESFLYCLSSKLRCFITIPCRIDKTSIWIYATNVNARCKISDPDENVKQQEQINC